MKIRAAVAQSVERPAVNADTTDLSQKEAAATGREREDPVSVNGRGFKSLRRRHLSFPLAPARNESPGLSPYMFQINHPLFLIFKCKLIIRRFLYLTSRPASILLRLQEHNVTASGTVDFFSYWRASFIDYMLTFFSTTFKIVTSSRVECVARALSLLLRLQSDTLVS